MIGFRYTGEDVFTHEGISVSVSAKVKLLSNWDDFRPGDEFIAEFSPFEPLRGRLIIPSHMKMDHSNDRRMEAADLKARYVKEVGPYNADQFWVFRR